MSDESLEMLLSATAAGDVDALHTVYERTSAKIFAVVTQVVGRRDWAEDVTQDVYVRVWRQAHRYRSGRGRPMTWIITIARNLAIDRIRAEGRRRHSDIDDLIEALPADQAGPEQSAIASDEARRLKSCVDELEEHYRVCIRLAYWQGCSHSELADRLGKPLGTVKSWTRRGLMMLRQCLDR